MFDTGLISPRRDYAKFNLHNVFTDRISNGTHSINISTDHSCHMSTITRTRSKLTYRHVPFGHVIGPMNKPAWSERLMASAALTGRTMTELCLPGISRYLEESLL
jgi:hypothetical protein